MPPKVLAHLQQERTKKKEAQETGLPRPRLPGAPQACMRTRMHLGCVRLDVENVSLLRDGPLPAVGACISDCMRVCCGMWPMCAPCWRHGMDRPSISDEFHQTIDEFYGVTEWFALVILFLQALPLRSVPPMAMHSVISTRHMETLHSPIRLISSHRLCSSHSCLFNSLASSPLLLALS
ncbi:hypothetical protein J3458_009524 [Metarhizium acridum]|uniref:uncharacterized protein n=1 Tax=Metarhizium acridum TaxID=92637 RepID=UPI001C6B7193|nr:hypothetical protein J3458_009524 [Metarhizium acridum]